MPDPPFGASASISDIIGSLLTSTVGTGWYTPLESREAVPLLNNIFPDKSTSFMMPRTYYVDFANPDQALSFMDNENCTPDFGALNVSAGPGAPPGNPFSKCSESGKYFGLMPFGSSSLALASARAAFAKFFFIAAIVIAIIAGVIMMGTVGRIIADSRRETAVFRAIGAKRLDIAQIYLTYALMLSLLIALTSLLIGFLLAQYANIRLADGLTAKALLAYNAQDLSRSFYLFAVEWRDMLYLVGFTLVAGLLSASLPLLNNARRNPIKDMRDDT
jgi:ABC-type antimicrobial peptide transport system permease subunit